MRIEPFEPSHLTGVTAHSKQERHQSLLESDVLTTGGTNWSVIAEDGLVAVGGLVRTDNEIGAWLLFTDRITSGRFVAIYRELVRRLAVLLDAGETVLVHIDPDYPEASRLAEKLGFRKDGEDRSPDGRSMIRMVANARIF